MVAIIRWKCKIIIPQNPSEDPKQSVLIVFFSKNRCYRVFSKIIIEIKITETTYGVSDINMVYCVLYSSKCLVGGADDGCGRHCTLYCHIQHTSEAEADLCCFCKTGYVSKLCKTAMGSPKP